MKPTKNNGQKFCKFHKICISKIKWNALTLFNDEHWSFSQGHHKVQHLSESDFKKICPK